jgi:DNA-binding LacI/PurR family transcriptional regulator
MNQGGSASPSRGHSLLPETAAMAGKRPTLYDVARLAGVSHQTVSRVVKGHTNVGADIRERVEAAIEVLGYKPNMAARSLATRRTHRVGALVYEMAEVGPSKVMRGAGARAREAGFLLDLVSLAPDDERAIEESIALINQQDLAGLMVFAPTDGVLAALSKVHFSVPVYVESDANELPGSPSPTLNEIGVTMLLEHLMALGHSRFFHIPGPQSWLAARGRERAYVEVLGRHGLSSVGTIRGDWSSRSGYEAASAMPLDQGATAVVAANDQMALGVLAALKERSVRVPEDVSVVGFDDIPESQFFQPPLTTVRLDFEWQGRVAMDRLLRLIPGAVRGTPPAPLAPQLFPRASTAPARS